MASNYEKIREENIGKYGTETVHLSFFGRLYSDRMHFVKDIPAAGTLIYNASMVPDTPSLPGVRVVPIAANAIADSFGDPRVQNMVLLGAVLACDPMVSKEAVWAALPQVVKSRPELIELNKRAILAGIEAALTAGL